MIQHFHASEPFLAPFDEGEVNHPAFAAAQRRSGYPHWVSVEMRLDPGRELVPEIDRALSYLEETYG